MMPRATSLLVLALCIGFAALPAVAQPVYWDPNAGGNGHYYEFFAASSSPTTTWTYARDHALTLSYNGYPGYLATVTSQAEQDFIWNNVMAQGNGYSAWLGGTDVAVEGTWVWDSGPEANTVLTYFDWYTGEPNGGTGENCIAMGQSLTVGGQWIDYPDSFKGSYIVEYSPGSVSTEQSTWGAIKGLYR